MIKAAVETVAENYADGVAAPLLFLILAGGAGGFFYKSINTMDSMLGYKNEKYMNFGWFPAHLDDIANFIPARLAALFLILSAPLCGCDGKNGVEEVSQRPAMHRQARIQRRPRQPQPVHFMCSWQGMPGISGTAYKAVYRG